MIGMPTRRIAQRAPCYGFPQSYVGAFVQLEGLIVSPTAQKAAEPRVRDPLQQLIRFGE